MGAVVDRLRLAVVKEPDAVNAQLRPQRFDLRYAWLGDVYVDLTANRLNDNGRETRLTPKAMGVLRELMLRQNQVVRRDDLLGLVWRDGFPTDDVLTHAIKELRRALNDDPRAPVLIETIPRVGYRLRATVRVVAEPQEIASALEVAAANEVEPVTSAPAARDGVAPAKTLHAVACDATAVAAAAQPHADVPPVAAARLPIMLATVVAIAALLVVAITLLTRRDSPARPDAQHPREAPVAEPAPPMALTSELGSEYFPTFSPDGSMIAYVAAAEGEMDAAIVLKGRDPAAQVVELAPVRKGHFMAHLNWSPDGSRILYAELGEGECTLRVIPVSGGAPRSLAPCTGGVIDGFDWTPESDMVIGSLPRDGVAGARGIATIALATGVEVPLDYHPRAPDDIDLYPRISPDGRWIAFRRGARPYSDIWLMPREGGEARLLAPLGARIRGLAWSVDSGSIIVSSDHGGVQALYRIALRDGAITPLGIENAHFPSVARRGNHVTYHQEFELSQMIAFELDSDGQPGPGRLVAPASRPDHWVSLSPSGRRVAFVSERSGSRQVWMHDFQTQQSIALSNESRTTPEAPQWAPDESNLLYVRRGADTSALVRVDLATGRSARIGPAAERIRFGSYAADGSSILYSSDRSGAWQIWRMDLDGSNPRQLGEAGGIDPRSVAGDPRIYYNKLTLDGLFRLDPATGKEEQVSALATWLDAGSYSIVDGELWLYRKAERNAEAQIVSRPVDGGAANDTRLRDISRIAYPGGFPAPALASFDRARKRVVTTMITRDGTDVFVAPLAR
jgi:Tol biopolymer transport system component/DNA-binding winged helix-turn-helix (wHTH) protein